MATYQEQQLVIQQQEQQVQQQRQEMARQQQLAEQQEQQAQQQLQRISQAKYRPTIQQQRAGLPQQIIEQSRQATQAREQFQQARGQAETQLTQYEQELGTAKSQIKSAMDYEAAYARVQKAQRKGMLWAIAAFGDKLDKQIAKDMIRHGVPASDTAMQRQYDEQLQNKLKILELKKQGFTPVYVKGVLTGFEDLKNQMSIPTANLGLHLEKYATPSQIANLERAGVIQRQVNVPIVKDYILPEGGIRKAVLQPTSVISPKYTPEQQKALDEYNKKDILSKIDVFLAGKTPTGGNWSWTGLYQKGIQSLSGGIQKVFVPEKYRAKYEAFSSKVAESPIARGAYEITTSLPTQLFFEPAFAAKSFTAFELKKVPNKAPKISYVEEVRQVGETGKYSLANFKIRAEVPPTKYELRTLDEILFKKKPTILTIGKPKTYEITTPLGLRLMDGKLISTQNIIKSQRVGAKQFDLGVLFGKNQAKDLSELGNKNIDKLLLQRLAEEQAGRAVSQQFASRIVGKQAQYSEGDLLTVGLGKFKVSKSGKNIKINVKPKIKGFKAKVLTRSEEAKIITQENLFGLRTTIKLKPEQSERLLLGDIAFAKPKANKNILFMRGVTKIGKPIPVSEDVSTLLINKPQPKMSKSEVIKEVPPLKQQPPKSSSVEGAVSSRMTDFSILSKPARPTYSQEDILFLHTAKGSALNLLPRQTSSISVARPVVSPARSLLLFSSPKEISRTREIQKVEQRPAIKQIQKIVQKPISKMVERLVQKPSEKVIQKVQPKVIQKPMLKQVQKFSFMAAPRLSPPKTTAKPMPFNLYSPSNKKRRRLQPSRRGRRQRYYLLTPTAFQKISNRKLKQRRRLSQIRGFEVLRF